jgi:hypothetical protein
VPVAVREDGLSVWSFTNTATVVLSLLFFGGFAGAGAFLAFLAFADGDYWWSLFMVLLFAAPASMGALVLAASSLSVTVDRGGVTIRRLSGIERIPWIVVDRVEVLQLVHSQGFGQTNRSVALRIKPGSIGGSRLSRWRRKDGLLDLQPTSILNKANTQRVAEAFHAYASANFVPCDLSSGYMSPYWHGKS